MRRQAGAAFVVPGLAGYAWAGIVLAQGALAGLGVGDAAGRQIVDFDAKLVPAGRLVRFADPRYEEKPPTWKLCFRSGREAVAAAREAAQGWLKAVADLRG